MGMSGITVIGFPYFLAFRGHAADKPRNLPLFGKLEILDLISDLIGNQFPAFAAVIRDGIWIKVRNVLSFFSHIFQSLLQKAVHQSHIGIFRVSADSGQAAHIIGGSINIDVHRINSNLGYQVITVKPTDHICFFHRWKFGTDDLFFLPSNVT